MRDPFQLDPAIRAYLQAENDYCERALADTKSLQDNAVCRNEGPHQGGRFLRAQPDGPYAYYARYRKGGQHPLLCRQPRCAAGTEEQLLLDGDALARGKAFFRLGATRHSPDHRLLAWLADDAGSEFYTARVRDIAAAPTSPTSCPMTSGAVVWTQDASAFYYVRLDENHRPAGVFRHGLGTPVAADDALFTRADPGFFVSDRPRIRRDASAIFRPTIMRHRKRGSSILPHPLPSRRWSRARQSGVQYEVEHHPDFNGGPALIIRTNADGAEDFKIVWCAARHARSRELARSRSASAGRLSS